MGLKVENDIKSSAGLRVWSGFNGTYLDSELKELIHEFNVGGIVLFKRNIESSEQLSELIEQINQYCKSKGIRRPIIAVDQEGGSVRRLFFVDTPSLYDLAQNGESSVSSAAYFTAIELKKHGIDVNLAPVLDRVSDARNHFLGSRSFGYEPDVVGNLGSLWINIQQKHGIRCVAKHFPGLGEAELDPHFHSLRIAWNIPQDMWNDLLPFEQAIRNRVWGIMVSHAYYDMIDPELPAFMSRTICKEWLRKRLGFGGIILSDDLDMKAVDGVISDADAAKYATQASVDCFLICNNTDHTRNFIEGLIKIVERDSHIKTLHFKSVERINNHYFVLFYRQ